MNRKIFQLFFVLIIITAFGVIIKNYVDSIISDYSEYKLVISKPPKTVISRLSPIKIELSKEVNTERFPLNVPIENSIFKTKPEIDGYVYFTDAKTMEFQPNEPLKAGHEYHVKIDIEKLFPSLKYKPYHYKLNTPKLSFNVNFNEITYFDTIKTEAPYLNGYISFNDFVEYEKKLKILNAIQKGANIKIDYNPGKNDNVLEFVISGIERRKNNDHISLSWNGSKIQSTKKDSTTLNIIAKDSFNIVNCATIFFPTPYILIKFSDAINNINSDSLLFLNNELVKTFSVKQNEIIIPIEHSNEFNTLKILNGIQGANNSVLTTNFKYNFQFYQNNTYANLKHKNHYFNSNDFNNFLEIESVNLKQINVEVYHVPDKNMMQFLQVNNIDGANEIERVGKSIFKKDYNLESNSLFNPNSLTNYTIDLIGANLSEPGLYHFKTSYNKEHQFHHQQNSFVNMQSHYNIIFSEIAAIAKHTTTDSLYIYTFNIGKGTPIKNARIEIFDYQQNKVGTLISDQKGKAVSKVEEKNLLIRILHNNEISYLKLNADQQTSSLNNNGIKTTQGYLCNASGLKKNYAPNDSIKVAIILKQNGKTQTYINNHCEIKLIDPNGNSHASHHSEIPNFTIIKYADKVPSNSLAGWWSLNIKNDEAEFNFPFEVNSNINIELPLVFNYNKRKNTISISPSALNTNVKNLGIKLSIGSYITKLKNNYSQYNFSTNTFQYDTLTYSKQVVLNKLGKAQVKLPAWVKQLNHIEFKASYQEKPNTLFYYDTVISIGKSSDILGMKSFINQQGYLHINLTKFNVLEKSAPKNSITKLQLVKNNTVYFDTTLLIAHKSQLTLVPNELPETGFDIIVQNENSSIRTKHYFETEKKNVVSDFPKTLTKNPFYIGDSIELNLINISKPCLITIENSEQVYHQFYIYDEKTAEIKFKITEDMAPGAYISSTYLNSNNFNNSLEFFKVSPSESNEKTNIVIDAPFDWKPETPINYSITNKHLEPIQFLVLLNKGNDSSQYDIPSYFSQQQSNAIINYCSLKKKFNSYKIPQTYQNLYTNYNTNVLIDIKGPYFLESGEFLKDEFTSPKNNGSIAIDIIGINPNSGLTWIESHKAQVFEPLSIISHNPIYVNADDFIEFNVDILNNTNDKEKITIELSNTENLDITSPMFQELTINNKSKITFTIAAKIKKNIGIASVQLNANINSKKATKTIRFPVHGNPSYLANSSSHTIIPNEQWQKKITPFGIKGTNNALFEISNTYIPNVSKIIDNLSENKTQSISALINRAFPLIYYNELVSDEELMNQNTSVINNTLLQLLSMQHTNGSFTQNDENKLWLNSYAGHFMQVAYNYGYMVNDGMLNKWIRYQKTELQRVKATHENGSELYAYIIYTLCLSKAIILKELNTLVKSYNESFINKCYAALSYLALNKDKSAYTHIKPHVIYREDLTLLNKSLLLQIAVKYNTPNTVNNQIKKINSEISRNKTNPTDVSIALASILSAISLQKSTPYKIDYQINNGKDITLNSKSTITKINIPLEFTLAKNTDFINKNIDTMYINLWQTGNPQKVYNPIKNIPNISSKNTYKALNGDILKTLSLKKGDYIEQNLNYVNKSDKKQSISITVPIASGLKLKNYQIENRYFTNFNHNGFVEFQLELKPFESKEINVLYECFYNGIFVNYPIQTFNNNMLYQKAFSEQPKLIIK